MDDSLYDPKPETDVHMGVLGFDCTDCHASEEHKIIGASHGSMALEKIIFIVRIAMKMKFTKMKILTNILVSVACETCHIPKFAKEIPTKTWWDWSKAGEDRTDIKDEYGMETYGKIKGKFIWAKNVVPTYNGITEKRLLRIWR